MSLRFRPVYRLLSLPDALTLTTNNIQGGGGGWNARCAERPYRAASTPRVTALRGQPSLSFPPLCATPLCCHQPGKQANKHAHTRKTRVRTNAHPSQNPSQNHNRYQSAARKTAGAASTRLLHGHAAAESPIPWHTECPPPVGLPAAPSVLSTTKQKSLVHPFIPPTFACLSCLPVLLSAPLFTSKPPATFLL